jgi:putative 3-hydroxymyristoyl/3-hydroxydecanoyl-(acyl carrier protein) dehydratase
MQLKNNLYKIIRKEGVGPVVNYAIELIPSCVIYAAHFPGEPITPGVCIVQMGKELVEELLSEQRSTLCKLMITKVKNVKFLSIISPNEMLQLTYQVKKLVTSEDGTSVETQLIVLSEEKPMAKISLVLRTV